MATRSRAAKKSGISVDFSNTETSGVLEEGDYLVEVDEVEDKESSTGNPMLVFTFKVTEGEGKGRKLFHNCSLQPQALFNLRAVLEALGNEVPQGVLELDPSDLIGQTCGVSSTMHSMRGRPRPASPNSSTLRNWVKQPRLSLKPQLSQQPSQHQRLRHPNRKPNLQPARRKRLSQKNQPSRWVIW